MPQADLVMNADIALKPFCSEIDGESCGCGCGNCGGSTGDCESGNYPFPIPPVHYPVGPAPKPPYCTPCPPPPPYGYPPYYYCPPPPPQNGGNGDCNCGGTVVSVTSIEAQIAKLSKKSATIRKMLDNLINKNKSIVISIGAGATYNFGTYTDSEESETEYGTSIEEILQSELEAIKDKITELAAELEVEDVSVYTVEKTVTSQKGDK